MKKVLFGMIAVALCIGLNSCKKEAAATPEGEGTEQVAQAPEEAPAASLSDIVEKAKAEGANWSADEWKEQTKNALLAFKPYAVAFNEVMKKVMSGDNSALEEGKKLETDYPNFSELMNSFVELAGNSENGKACVDEAELAKMMEELGVPAIDD